MADVSMCKEAVERTVKLSDMEEHVKLFDNYVKIDDFKDLDQDMVRRDRMNTVIERICSIEKKQSMTM